MAELQQILVKLNGEIFLSIFRDAGLTRESLLLLKPSHLDTLIGTAQFGQRVIFEHNLVNWQIEEGVHLQADQCSGCASSNSNLAERTLAEILSESASGKQILEYYNKTKVLSPKYRKLLAATIATYLISSDVRASPKIFESLSGQISTLFLSESKDIYYIHKKGKKPGGSLYTKYHSTLLKLRRDGIISKKLTEKEPRKARNNNSCQYFTQEKSWLKYNVEPFDEVRIKWELTFEERRQMLEDDTDLSYIFEEWPLYKQSFGHLLIEADFHKLYPEKKNLLFEKWENFRQAVRRLFDIYIKDSHSLATSKLFKEEKFPPDAADSVICYLLHAVLGPTSRKYKTCKQTNKKYLVKATIADSRNSFLICAATNSELQSKLKLMIDENYKEKNTIQPIICAIGGDIFECKEYFVYFANIFYKFDNVIKCVDVCFKIFHVLNLKYPSECKSIWLFIQQYFYDIALKSHEKSSALCAVLNDLNNN